MEEDFEEENEGIINMPKVMTLSNKSLSDKNIEILSHKRKNINNSNLQQLLLCNKFDNNVNDKLSSSLAYEKSKIWLKNEDITNSTTSKSSMNEEKIKKVTFSTVEIIRVKNYKRYNKINTIKKNEEDESELNNCILF
jgi:hypothetical protein